MTTLALSTDLQLDKQVVERYLHELLHQGDSHSGSNVREAMCYAVSGRAQRIRPLLSLRVARMLGAESTGVLRAGCAVELLHCASLIVDDLPCMDNEEWRRDRATVHVAFGEATAVLAAFALVALSVRSAIDLQAGPADLGRQLRFQSALLRALDCGSLIDGQALDLSLPRLRKEAQRHHVSELKTVPLFQLAVQAGAIGADLSPEESRTLDQFGREFGLAFQYMDDYLDDEADSRDSLEVQLARARSCLKPFYPAGREIEGILDYLHAKACQKNYSNR